MANINAQLPQAATISFHPATESLQRENLTRPIIPKTEVTSAYQKMRDEQERNNQFSTQSRTLFQDQKNQNTQHSSQQESSQQNTSLQHKRALFFARKGVLCQSEKGDVSAYEIKDFTAVISVIQARYRCAVNPLPEPVVDDLV
ncbi:hypothetical protein [Psychromonas sp. MME2]|uniref:hypothetical protein n=1 Tax=unclassified Psychromonas TaxID=2614957 RepID=UPI00339C6687